MKMFLDTTLFWKEYQISWALRFKHSQRRDHLFRYQKDIVEEL